MKKCAATCNTCPDKLLHYFLSWLTNDFNFFGFWDVSLFEFHYEFKIDNNACFKKIERVYFKTNVKWKHFLYTYIIYIFSILLVKSHWKAFGVCHVVKSVYKQGSRWCEYSVWDNAWRWSLSPKSYSKTEVYNVRNEGWILKYELYFCGTVFNSSRFTTRGSWLQQVT